jgi:hypothetical protein
MMKRTNFLLILLLIAAVFATSANATFVELTGFNDTFAFTGMGITAEVHCIVYQDGGTYKYTYEITNNSDDIDLSFFSVGILDGADVTSRGFDAGTGVDPEYWEIVGSPAQSVNAEFEAIGNGQTSSVLRFISDFAPVEAENGALLGYDSGLPKFAQGSIYTPMPLPEPATIALFGIGSLITLVRKKRFA